MSFSFLMFLIRGLVVCCRLPSWLSRLHKLYMQCVHAALCVSMQTCAAGDFAVAGSVCIEGPQGSMSCAVLSHAAFIKNLCIKSRSCQMCVHCQNPSWVWWGDNVFDCADLSRMHSVSGVREIIFHASIVKSYRRHLQIVLPMFRYFT
jgi:hypothetical protein